VPTYRVLLNGENFRFEQGGKRIGFYTTRFVQASSPEEAELAAVQELRNEPKLANAVKDPAAPAMLYAEEIVEVEPDSVPETELGLAFYDSESS
jgi:hypothetical protein